MNEQARTRYQETQHSFWHPEGHPAKLTIAYIAKVLPVTQTYLNILILRGRLPANKHEGKWVIDNQVFADYWNTRLPTRAEPRARKRSALHQEILAWCVLEHPEWMTITEICDEVPFCPQNLTNLLRVTPELGEKRMGRWWVKSAALCTYWHTRWSFS